MNIYIAEYDFDGTKREENAFQKELSRKLLEYCIFRETGVKIHELTLCKNDHGKPYFDNFYLKYNISHCRSAVAVATGMGEIGVDMEKIRAFKMDTARYISTDNEYEKIVGSKNPQEDFFSLWTFKEAFVKMLGVGLSYSLKKATLDTILKEYPDTKIYSTIMGEYSVTAMEMGGKDPEIIKINYRDIL